MFESNVKIHIVKVETVFVKQREYHDVYLKWMKTLTIKWERKHLLDAGLFTFLIMSGYYASRTVQRICYVNNPTAVETLRLHLQKQLLQFCN